jgi:hypothetical protein
MSFATGFQLLLAQKKGEARRLFRRLRKRRKADGRRQPAQVRLVGRSVRLAFDHRGQDAAEFTDAEEAVAAGIAAVGGESEPALQKNEGAIFDAITGDMLDIEIAAARAMGEAFEDGSDLPGLKAPIAAVAAPRAQAGDTESEVEDSVAVRPKAIITATLWTNHRCSEAVAQNTEKAGREQDGGIRRAGGVLIANKSEACCPRICGVENRRNLRRWTSRRSSAIISPIYAAGAAPKEAQ